VDLLRPVAWPAFSLITVYLLFVLVLPTLADLTPPGVDAKLVAAAANQEAVGAREGCADACKGMGCPTGWTTARSPDDVCKCICARIDPGVATPWDGQQKTKQDSGTLFQQPSPPQRQAPDDGVQQSPQEEDPPQEQPLQQAPSEQDEQQSSDDRHAPEQHEGGEGNDVARGGVPEPHHSDSTSQDALSTEPATE
jgi:hypothetical protein